VPVADNPIEQPVETEPAAGRSARAGDTIDDSSRLSRLAHEVGNEHVIPHALPLERLANQFSWTNHRHDVVSEI